MRCKLYVAAVVIDDKNEFTAFASATSEEQAKKLLEEKFNAQILKIKELGDAVREIPTRYDLEVLIELIQGEGYGRSKEDIHS